MISICIKTASCFFEVLRSKGLLLPIQYPTQGEVQKEAMREKKTAIFFCLPLSFSTEPHVWLLYPLPVMDLPASFSGISAGSMEDSVWGKRRAESCRISRRKPWSSGHKVYSSVLMDVG